MRRSWLLVAPALSFAVLGCGDPPTPAEMTSEATTSAATVMGEPSTPTPAGLAELSPADQALAIKQKLCPVSDEPLGSMGAPVKIDVQGQAVFMCCAHCEAAIAKSPEKYLAKARGEAPVEAVKKPAADAPKEPAGEALKTPASEGPSLAPAN